MADHHKILGSTEEAFNESKAEKRKDVRPIPCANCTRCFSCVLLGAVCTAMPTETEGYAKMLPEMIVNGASTTSILGLRQKLMSHAATAKMLDIKGKGKAVSEEASNTSSDDS